jgi:hypothetical protein
MLTMAGFTVLYETQRPGQSGRWSLAVIIVLLSGIFGVIFVPEQNPTHYIFAAAAFFAIIGFMVGHTFYGSTGTGTGTGVVENLRIILYAQFLYKNCSHFRLPFPTFFHARSHNHTAFSPYH